MINVKEQQDLLLEVARKLKHKITVYAIGGTAMMFLGLKDATKDIDLVFSSQTDMVEFSKAALNLGYEAINSKDVYGLRSNQPLMLTRGSERFDLFVNDVISFVFSDMMIERASSTFEFDHNLVLKIANYHDIILMKCATDRLKDKDDAMTIVNKNKINWNLIINEAVNQKRLGKERAVMDLGFFLEDIEKHMKVHVPAEILDKLWKLVEKQIKSKV